VILDANASELQIASPWQSSDMISLPMIAWFMQVNMGIGVVGYRFLARKI
jgi:hypothetical protein